MDIDTMLDSLNTYVRSELMILVPVLYFVIKMFNKSKVKKGAYPALSVFNFNWTEWDLYVFDCLHADAARRSAKCFFVGDTGAAPRRMRSLRRGHDAGAQRQKVCVRKIRRIPTWQRRAA